MIEKNDFTHMCEVKVVENQVRKNSIAQSVAKKNFGKLSNCYRMRNHKTHRLELNSTFLKFFFLSKSWNFGFVQHNLADFADCYATAACIIWALLTVQHFF